MLLIGFVLGLWHAFDLDHIGAMITFVASRDSSPRQAIKYSVLWATGHALMLLLMTLLVMGFHVEVSGEVASIMEFMVGAMLVVLALDMLRRMRSIKMHSHHHLHKGESVHDHLHVHLRLETHTHESHTHVHAAKDNYPLRALLVGLMHGMAGSAALILVVISTVNSLRTAVIYVIFFSVGAMAGMGALSMFMAMQLRRSAFCSLELASRVRGYAAIAVLSVGLFLMSKIGLEFV
jgi:high-affinity nickel permease